MGYSFRLAARVLLYSSSHIHDSTYYGLCYTSRGAQAVVRTDINVYILNVMTVYKGMTTGELLKRNYCLNLDQCRI